MIESALVFALGALAAGILALLLFPAFTRRASRLSRAEAEARLPRTLNEMTAAKDAVRAVYAAKLARREVEVETLRDELVAARNAAAHDQVQAAAAKADRAAAVAALQDAERRLAAAHEDIRSRDEALARAAAAIRDLERRAASDAQRLAAADARILELTEETDRLRRRTVQAAIENTAWGDGEDDGRSALEPRIPRLKPDNAPLPEKPLRARPRRMEAMPPESPAMPTLDVGFRYVSPETVSAPSAPRPALATAWIASRRVRRSLRVPRSIRLLRARTNRSPPPSLIPIQEIAAKIRQSRARANQPDAMSAPADD